MNIDWSKVKWAKDPTYLSLLKQIALSELGYYQGALDNWWGSKSETAYKLFLTNIPKIGFASSFADPADIAAFKKCKATGKSDQECFKVGDNGIGFTGIDVTNENVPYVAVQPDYMIEKFGDAKKAAGEKVIVTINGVTKTCIVGDRMPYIANTKNGAVIDLAPGAQKLFGLKPPFMVAASWAWA